MKLIEAVGIRIDSLIKGESISMYELAKRAGMQKSTVWKIIHPDLTLVKTVKLDTVYQIAATLGMSLAEFFDDSVFDGVSD